MYTDEYLIIYLGNNNRYCELINQIQVYLLIIKIKQSHEILVNTYNIIFKLKCGQAMLNKYFITSIKVENYFMFSKLFTVNTSLGRTHKIIIIL